MNRTWLKRSAPRRRNASSSFRPVLEQLEDRLTPSNLPGGFAEATVVSGLAGPTAMEVLPDGRMLVSEQGGTLRVVKNGALLATPFVSLNVDSSGERGLLGVTVDANFASDQFVYLYYTVSGSTAHNRVSRFTAAGDVAVPGSEAVLMDLDPLGPTIHNGGGLHFGADGKLYISVGENGTPANAQTLANRLGKILRINANGTIPADNPFFNVAVGANRAIWALGLRNPFTFAVQPGTGTIFINDVGQNTWEEIDQGRAGANYGWPNTEGVSTDSRFVPPLFAFGHGGGDMLGCAITGGTFYNPTTNQFPAEFVGDYFFADLCNSWIRRYDPITHVVGGFATSLPALPVDLRVDAAGNLFYLARGTGSNTGVIGRISYPPGQSLLQFGASVFTVTEGGTATITVSRGGDTSGTVTVNFATGGGSATAGSDFDAVAGTLTFGPSQLSQTFNVPTHEDAAVEGDETVVLVLSNPGAGAVVGSPGAATLFIRDNDGTANQRFVASLYHDLLGRAADGPGLAHWAGLLDQGQSRSQVVFTIEQSGEYRNLVIQRVYNQYLGRSVDPTGQTFWTNFLGSGGTEEQFTAFVLSSQEYLNRHGGTPGTFLQAVYEDVMGREIEEAGVRFWGQMLAGGASSTQVALSILRSTEAERRLVQRLYQQFLHRSPDPAGRDANVNALQAGVSWEQLLAGIAASDEYFAGV
jgi:glucose/arabinose dehydrogenase